MTALWVAWLLGCLAAPLLRAHFYATETEAYRGQIFFYRHVSRCSGAAHGGPSRAGASAHLMQRCPASRVPPACDPQPIAHSAQRVYSTAREI